MSDEIDKALPITVYCDNPFFLTAPSQSAINTDALDIVDFFDTRGFELEAHNPISSLIEPTKNAVVFFSNNYVSIVQDNYIACCVSKNFIPSSRYSSSDNHDVSV